jgi:hypothetical protein
MSEEYAIPDYGEPDHVEPDHSVDQLRVPPHSIQAEQSVVGGLMLAIGFYSPLPPRNKQEAVS